MLLTSSTIIQDIWTMRQTKTANLAFFYFDYRDAAKQEARNFLSSSYPTIVVLDSLARTSFCNASGI